MQIGVCVGECLQLTSEEQILEQGYAKSKSKYILLLFLLLLLLLLLLLDVLSCV